MSENKTNAFDGIEGASTLTGAELFSSNDPFASAADDRKFIGDLDEFLKSMGVTPIATSPAGAYEAFSVSADASGTQAVHDTGEASTVAFEPIKVDTPTNEQYAENEDAKSYLQAQKKKKKFRKNFRVLSGDAPSDEAIIDSQHTAEASSNVADTVSDEADGDIFTTVEKAERKKRSRGVFNANGKSVASMKKKAKSKKQEQVLVSAKALRESLAKKLKLQKNQIILLCILGVVSLVLYFLPSLYAVSNPLEFMFSQGGKVYGIINIVCLLLAVIFSFDRYIAAGKSVSKLGTDSNTGLIVLSVFVLLHDILTVVLSTSGLGGVDLYTVYAVFAMTLAVLSENLKCKMAYRNIAVVCKGTSVESINPVDSGADAAVFLKGIAKKGEGSLLYCAKAESIKSLNPDIGHRSDENRFYNFAYLIMLLAGIVCGIIMVGRSSQPSMFLTGLLSCVCLCGPTVCEIARTVLLFIKNSELNSQGAAITSFDGVEQMGKSKAIVMDSSAIFTAKVEKFKRVKAGLMPQKHSAVYAASLLKGAQSLIYKGFEEFEANLNGALPTAEDVEYIPGAGYKGSVISKDVLVGNRKLMLKNSIAVPTEAEEKRYGGNMFVYYVAVDGILVATFLVSYALSSPIKSVSPLFNKTGLVLLLSSKEPDLREKYISSRLGIDVSAIKILGEQGRELLQEYKQNKTMRQSNSLVCRKKNAFTFNLAVLAHRLYDADRLVLGMNIAGQVIFFGLIIAAVFMNVPAVFSPLSIIIMRILWSALTVLIASAKK